MNNQNNNNDTSSRMMWIMMLCCIAPIAFIFLSGTIASKGNWIAILIMAIFVVIYILFMNKLHGGGHKNDDKENSINSHSHSHGCH